MSGRCFFSFFDAAREREPTLQLKKGYRRLDLFINSLNFQF